MSGPNKTMREGDSANLTCEIVKGVPKPQVTWLKNRKSLPKEMNTTLLLTNVTDEDEGIYTCSAKNAAGFYSDSKNVTVESKLYDMECAMGCLKNEDRKTKT